MDVGSLQDSPPLESTGPAQARRSESVERPSPETRTEAKPDVTISQEARDLNERARTEAAKEERRQDTAREERAATEARATQPQFIAVRLGTGPPPLEQQREQPSPEDVILQGLRDRSQLPKLDGLIETEEDREKAEEAKLLPRQRDAKERPQVGQDSAQSVGLASEDLEFTPVPSAPEAFASRDPGERDRAVAEALERAQTQSLGRADEPEDLERAASVAPQTAPLLGTDDTRRADVAAAVREDDSDEREERAREVLTLGGTVEATASDQLVTRFIGNRGDGEEPGPTPQPREELGERAGESQREGTNTE